MRDGRSVKTPYYNAYAANLDDFILDWEDFAEEVVGEMRQDACDKWAWRTFPHHLRGPSIIYLFATQIHMYFPWKGVSWAGTLKAQLTWLLRRPLWYHGYLLSFVLAD